MFRLSRTVWTQLAILATVTLVAGGVMAFGFVKVPALFGIGRYTVIVQLPASGGLYPTSVVTYRGTEIGRVSSIDVDADGVRAVLKLNSAIKVPAPVTAAVHSRSAIGEQFLELTPDPGTDDHRTLRAGDVIGVDQVRIPADIAHLLDATNLALRAIPNDDLRTVIDEANKAVGGLGAELSRIVAGSTSLAIEGGQAAQPLAELIDETPPVPNSQVQTADSVLIWAQRLASITGQLAAEDRAFAGLLSAGAPALNEADALLGRVAPALPVLLANMVSLGQIAVTFRQGIEQLLVLFPQGTAVMSAITLADSGLDTPYRGIYLDFNLNMNYPPPCNTGFLPARQQRVPAAVDYPDYPDRPAGELYCRVPQDSDLNVRGARNIPCENNPAKRAPTVEMCESDQWYVPLNDGYNWKGDPNATASGQAVPQDPPVAFVPYDPATGSYLGPDGQRHIQADLVPQQKEQTWQTMLIPPSP
ncbi:MCE family protein [Mycolicibacter arupensis]|uniref:MCE family protein n=1 Tax=Mycolicibacter arupensis TaxID=342002 RepID=UPI00122C1E4A|nr:MlaD family protein [Mycolicibacter arupensis]KAA1430382.1 MCE family protein [Mycolicibacter arupensis]